MNCGCDIVPDQEVSRVSVKRISVLLCWCSGLSGRRIGKVGDRPLVLEMGGLGYM